MSGRPDPQTKPVLVAVAVFITFLINGAFLGTWVSRIPAVQLKLGLSEGGLGLVLLGLSAGVLIGLSLAGGWIARFGSRAMTVAGAAMLCLTLPALSLAPNAALLWLSLFLFGGAMSVMDVAMNEQAIFVERKARRPLMSRFHGAFSIGGLVGALLGAALAGARVPLMAHFGIAVVLFGGGMAAVMGHLLPRTEAPVKKGPLLRIPDRVLWPLGAVALISSFAEGAMADWSAVYLTEILKSTPGTAALGYAAYSLAMTIARLTGDHLKTHFSPVNIVRAGAGIAVVGLTLVVLADHTLLTLIGFATVGLGLANIIPIAFTAAGNYPGIPSGTGIAAVASIGYAGFLAGPPLIGFIGEAGSLRVAFCTMVVLLATLPWLAGAVSGKSSKKH